MDLVGADGLVTKRIAYGRFLFNPSRFMRRETADHSPDDITLARLRRRAERKQWARRALKAERRKQHDLRIRRMRCKR